MNKKFIPDWSKIGIFGLFVIWAVICVITAPDCADPRLQADYEDHVAGCTAAYGEGNDTQCIENVNARFNR